MRLTPLACCLSTILLTAACGNADTQPAKQSTAASTTPTTSAPSAANSGQRTFTIAATGGSYQDSLRQLYFEPFGQQTNQAVLDEVFDGGFGIIQAKVQSGNANWDVVQMEAQDLSRACDDGLLEPLDWAKLGGKEAFIDGASFSECGVGSIVWSTAIIYDGNKMQEGPKSWADFWDLKKFPGKRSLRKTPEYALESAVIKSTKSCPRQKV